MYCSRESIIALSCCADFVAWIRNEQDDDAPKLTKYCDEHKCRCVHVCVCVCVGMFAHLCVCVCVHAGDEIL